MRLFACLRNACHTAVLLSAIFQFCRVVDVVVVVAAFVVPRPQERQQQHHYYSFAKTYGFQDRQHHQFITCRPNHPLSAQSESAASSPSVANARSLDAERAPQNNETLSTKTATSPSSWMTTKPTTTTTLQTPQELKQTIDQLLLATSSNNPQQQEQENGELTESFSETNRLSQRTCDTLMGLCVAWEEWEYVSQVLELMQRHGLQQEHSTFRASLKTCWEFGNAEAAQDVLKAMDNIISDDDDDDSNGISSKPTDVGLVVSTLCKSHSSTDNKDGHGSDQRKSKYSRSTQWRQGWSMLKAAAATPARSVEPKNATVYASIIPIKAYHDVLARMKRERRWRDAVRLLRWMERGTESVEQDNTQQRFTAATTDDGGHKAYGFLIPPPTNSTYQSVVECCLDNQELDAAVQILYDAIKVQDLKLKPSIFQVVLAALAKKRQWRKALQLLDFMVEMDVPRSVVNYNTVISACAKAREVGMAKNLLNRMKQRDNIRPDEISFNSVIGACANTARWKEALEVLDQCYREPGVTPNIYIYTNAMRACAKGGKGQRALNLLQVAKDKGLPIDSYCYTAVIDACVKGGMWKKAMLLFDEMEEKGVEPTEVTYSVTISALGSGLQWERALLLLEVMREKDMNINLITYNAAITALAKAARKNSKDFRNLGIKKLEKVELWPKALSLLNRMKEDGIQPDGFCYSSAISCCGAEGRWLEACDLLETMKKGGPKTRPNKIAYTAAIGACGRAGQPSKALELFDTMKSEGLVVDRVAYNAVFSALRTAKNPDKTFELWREMCQTRRQLPRRPNVNSSHRPDNTSPDIITVSDCIATLSRAGRVDQMDEVFHDAVKQGIVLRSNSLDAQWEVDLSGMPFPVARAACRFLLGRLVSNDSSTNEVQDMAFITGIGKAQQIRKDGTLLGAGGNPTGSVLDRKDPTTSLREFVQGILATDFDPPLTSLIPERAKGTVVIKKEVLSEWLKKR